MHACLPPSDSSSLGRLRPVLLLKLEPRVIGPGTCAAMAGTYLQRPSPCHLLVSTSDHTPIAATSQVEAFVRDDYTTVVLTAWQL